MPGGEHAFDFEMGRMQFRVASVCGPGAAGRRGASSSIGRVLVSHQRRWAHVREVPGSKPGWSIGFEEAWKLLPSLRRRRRHPGKISDDG